MNLHAADEAEAISRAEEVLAEHPELDFDRSDTTVRARLQKPPFVAEDDY
jgi:hypothetical protein